MYDELKEIWGGLIGPESPFEVVEKEVRGVSIRTFAQAPPSLREVWLASAAFADRDYLVYQDERRTYADSHREVAALANWIRQQGIEPGDRVAICYAQLPRVDAYLLGMYDPGYWLCWHERLVGRRRNGLWTHRRFS